MRTSEIFKKTIPHQNAYILATKKGIRLQETYLSDNEKTFFMERYNNLNYKPKGLLIQSGTYLQVAYLYNVGYNSFIVHNNSLYQMWNADSDMYAESDFETVKKKSEELLSKQLDYKFVLKNPNGTMFKDKKYKRQSDTFSALMTESGYYDLFEHLSYKDEYKDKNPELQNSNIPEWLTCGYYKNASPKKVKGVEVHKYFGAKKPTEKIEVNYYEKIKWHFDNILIAMNYGLVTKDIFKKMEDAEDFDYKYILVYSPIEYFNEIKTTYGGSYFDIEDLKEDVKIKEIFKDSKKVAIKATKCGKSAIAFKTFEDLGTFYDKLADDYKERCRMITLEKGNRGAEISRSGEAKSEVRTKALEELLASF